jgi:hypothetical protein
MAMSAQHLKVFIGFDSKEPAAYAVAESSLHRHASRTVAVTPLIQPLLRKAGFYTRDRKPNEATEFSLTRFLVPHLSDYQGFSLFMDCDVLLQADVFDVLLYAMADPGKAVYVVQHDYVPKDLVKFDGHEQARYPKKNWSSVMLFDNARCQALTPAYVNTATGLDLHRFHWLSGDDQIGALPTSWNHLVGEYAPTPDACLLHFTNGTPCFFDYSRCDQANLWWAEYDRMLAPARATEAALNIEVKA